MELKAPISLQRFSAVAVVQRCFQMVQRCFYSAVALKSVAVARAFSAVYVCGPVCWNVRFFAYVRLHRWNVHVPIAHVQGISNSRPTANFQCNGGAPNSSFLNQANHALFGSSIPETLGRRNNSTFLLSVAGSVSFESLIFSAFYIFP